jgi:hypothetical protein
MLTTRLVGLASVMVAVVKTPNRRLGKAIGIAGDLRRDSFAQDIVRRTAKQFGGSTLSGAMSATPARGDRRVST